MNDHSTTGKTGPDTAATALLHELQVQTVELEMQNEELRRMRAELVSSRNHYRSLYDAAPVVFLTLDASGTIVEVNLTGATLLGVVRESLVGRRLAVFVVPEDQDRWQRLLLDALQDGEAMKCELVLQCGDGRRCDAHVDSLRVVDADGVPPLRMVLTDVTTQRATTKALKDNEERLRLFFEHSPIGIMMVARDFRLMEVNDAFCGLVGYSADELRTMSFVELTHPEDRGADLEYASDMLAGRLSHSAVEKRYIHKTGRLVWVRVTRAVVRDDTGEVRYGIGLVEDIGASRDAERLRIDHLEQQRSVLVREVHHRIKNNLQGVISLIEQLKHKSPQAADALEEAAAQVGTIAVVHGLYSHTLASEVGPRELVRAIVESVVRLSGVAIACHESHDDSDWNWRLNSRDTVSVAMVVNELVYNAIKHTAPSGKVEVSFGGHSGAFGIRVHNGPATLPPAFDFSAGIGVGTGLTLVASLLPRPGATLLIRQRIDGVEAYLRLTHPCANVVPATGQETET